MQKYIIIFITLIFSGCVSSKMNNTLNERIYKCIDVNDELLEYYHIYTLVDTSNGKQDFLLSLKFGRGVDKPPFEKYDKIEENKIVRLTLIPQDTLYIEPENAIRKPRGSYEFIFNDVLFLKNDTIKAKIYRSEDVFDRFVKIK